MKQKIFRVLAVFLIVNTISQACFPALAWALTGGPSQPEVQSFEPVGTTDMVDLFTGDFTYNIPLLDVGGYPINMSYHSGITMDQEASWVGLGWNINPGVVNRNMRGLPDDFDGDIVTKEFNSKPNKTYGVDVSVSPEAFGKEFPIRLKFGLGINYNNYAGFGLAKTISASFTAAKGSKGKLNGSLGLTSSSSDGLSVSADLSFASKNDKKTSLDLNIGTSYNSRGGLSYVSYGASASKKHTGSGNKVNATSIGRGSSISFGMPTYVPQITMPMENTSVTFSGKFSATFFGLEPAFYTISGSYSEQRLAEKSQSNAAYGYFNSDKGMGSYHSLHDFNREKDGSFTENTPRLPLANHSYDIYSVSCQGMGGMFRPYRGGVGYVYDTKGYNNGDSYSLGADFAAANIVKGGVDINVVDVKTTTGVWHTDNELANQNFSPNVTGSTYESVYFKEAGDKSVDDDNLFFNAIDGANAVRPDLEDLGGLNVRLAKRWVNQNDQATTISGPIKRNKRKKRNQSISFLSIKEAKSLGTQTSLYNNNEANDIYNQVPTTGIKGNQHHVGEITALRTDGSRYVFGIPAYNTLQREVTFAAHKDNGPDDQGLVSYSGSDNSIGNNQGLDNYFNRTTLPAYAHSYLLTAVLSTDYVDNDGVQGPTDGDMGSYTKFTYTKTQDNYKWRVPFAQDKDKANANEALKSIDTDDQGNYIYGEKELWYVSQIETKNHIAIFTLSDREDGIGVAGENGGAGSGRMKKLDHIKLYYKDHYKANPTTAIPIKTVHFVYDYSLCQGIPNRIAGGTQGNGKLTLKQVYFTYQDSERARFSPYKFTYAHSDQYAAGVNNPYNPNYNAKAYDRWGMYKPFTNYTENSENPYVNQVAISATKTAKMYADENSAVWELTKVNLPSGGTIQVNYESDDYAYVQDRNAMQMIKVKGLSTDGNIPGTANTLYSNGNGDLGLRSDHYNHIHFSLPDNVLSQIPSGSNATEQKQIINDLYLKGMDANNMLYFRFAVDMTKQDGKYEYITGYAEVDPTKTQVNTTLKEVSIALKGVSVKEKAQSGDVSPIAYAAIQFDRVSTPRYAYDQPNALDGGVTQVITAMANSSFIKNIGELIQGPVRSIMNQGKGRVVDITGDGTISAGCFIRLYNPIGCKYGGGSRVKDISINDNAGSTLYSTTSTANDTEYKQTFTYTLEEKDRNNQTRTISSGVAAYEPTMGGEENPFRLPIAFTNNRQQKVLMPDDRFFMEAPMGESFYPSPTVGYSAVKVLNVVPSTVKRHGTGYVLHEFYTAKDFPVYTQETSLAMIKKRPSLVMRLLKISNKEFMNASQGYAIHLNDMHGKPKGQWVYAEDQTQPISGVKYTYQTMANNSQRLDNTATVIANDGTVSDKTIGLDQDLVMDMREEQTRTHAGGVNINIGNFLVLAWPAIIPLALPTYRRETTRLRSAVATKVNYRYGILKTVEAFDLGSKISTSNLAYDAETGEVLLTSVQNGYDDPIYNFTYPAHWVQEGMAGAYNNIGFKATVAITTEGVATPDAIAYKAFAEGDEVMIVPSAASTAALTRFWIVKKANNQITLKDAAGVPPTVTSATIQVVRSGRRNLQSTPVGSIVCMANPLETTGGITNLQLQAKILQAEAKVYSDEWADVCDCDPASLVASNNPYYAGTKGIWRMQKSFTHLTQREDLGSLGIRKDGPFTTFSPFWNFTATNNAWAKNETGWTWVNEVTSYDRMSGLEVENKDRLDRYSAAESGFRRTMATAIAPNTQRRELFFNHFEDYDPNNCRDNKKTFDGTKIDKNHAHTGRRSIKVTGQDVKLDIKTQ